MILPPVAILAAFMIKLGSSFHLRSSVGGLFIRAQSTRAVIMVSTTDKKPSYIDQISTASIASAAVVAAAAVNAAVGMRPLSAPSVSKTFVYKDGASENRIGIVDEVGLPLVYDKELIQAYWEKQGSALTRRWTEFLGYAVPYLTKVITIIVSGGMGELKNNGATLARDARVIFEKLGPTYIKMGQMMSVRPDVLPEAALNELRILQDSVEPFDTATAVAQIESELGGPLGQFFSEISEKPVAAASLAQVYKARLLSGEFVAVKVQRPSVLETVSKDLYVLRRAAEVYQGLIDRFAPQQRTNYVGLLNEWAIGFYTELDFLNEAANQQRMRDIFIREGFDGLYIPTVHHSLSTRRVLVSEWVDGVKLSECEPERIKALIPYAQEGFLLQLLKVGFFHSDPHPGNLMCLSEARGNAALALIDFGLVASIKQSDMDTMISAIIHLANKDYASLVDDFINLEVLPSDCDRAKVIPLMDKALTPYVKGGGAKKYEEELRKIYGMDGTFSGSTGGFQAMTRDALTVLNDIPFSIPPYFALLGRAIITLEGIALTGDPTYGIIKEAYPFVARRLLDGDRPQLQQALQEILYARSVSDDPNGGQGAKGLKMTRLISLLNSALGVVSRSSTDSAFVDFDSGPDADEAVSTAKLLKFIVSEKAQAIREILGQEMIVAADILLRQATRKAYTEILRRLPRPPRFLAAALPAPELVPLPFLIPQPSPRLSAAAGSGSSGGNLNGLASLFTFRTVVLPPQVFVEKIAPRLSREEELYAISLTDVAVQSFGDDVALLVNGDALASPAALSRVFLTLASAEKAISLLGVRDAATAASVSQSLLQSQQLLGGGRGLGGESARDATLARNRDFVNEVVEAASDLSPEELTVLKTTLSDVIVKISGKLSERVL